MILSFGDKFVRNAYFTLDSKITILFGSFILNIRFDFYSHALGGLTDNSKFIHGKVLPNS